MMSNARRDVINQLLLCAVLLCAFLLGCTPMWNFDIWQHIRTGQLILERQSVPYVDWYSFTDSDRPWLEMHWLFQIVVAKLFAWGGINLLILTKAFLQMLTVLICFWGWGHRLPVSVKAACSLLLVICLSGRSIVRPDMVTNLLLALWLLILIRADDKPRLFWYLPLVQIVWTNCHGLFVLGLIVGGAYYVDRIARHGANGRWWLEKLPENPRLRWVSLVAALTLLSCLANPYFYQGVTFPLILFGKLGHDPSEEHMSSLDVFQQVGFKFYLVTELILWLLTALSFVWLACYRRLSLMRLLLFVGFSYLGWIAARNITVFAIVASTILCRNASDVLSLRGTTATPKSDELSRVLSSSILVVTLGLMLSVVMGGWHYVTGRDSFGLGELKDGYIHGAAQFAGRPGMPSRAFVFDYGQAAVFIFHNSPERKVFMDGRLEVYRDSTIEQYFKIVSDIEGRRPSFAEPLLDDNQDLPTIVIGNTSRCRRILAALLTYPQVRLVYADTTAAVFVQQSLAEELQLPRVNPAVLNFTHQSAADYFIDGQFE
ncbi:MAG: hypothetical protein ABGX22_23120 [Pirellulaceae bacterium]